MADLPRRAWAALRRLAAAPLPPLLAWLRPADVREALFLVGVGLLLAGGWQVWPPVGLILAGAVLVTATGPRRPAA